MEAASRGLSALAEYTCFFTFCVVCNGCSNTNTLVAIPTISQLNDGNLSLNEKWLCYMTYASTVYAVVVCLSVCHTPVLYQNS